MENLKITCAQFENKSGDKAYNLSQIQHLTTQAASQGSQVIAFHECSVTGYTFAKDLSLAQMLDLAEPVPSGSSVRSLIQIARENHMFILAGLFEKDADNRLYNTYICVNSTGVVAKYRKLHPFISTYLSPGNEYVVFDIEGWKCGILICYDNNVVENVRATALLGAQVIFMPHVTMCTPSSRPGAGFVDPKLWENREADPTSLRTEFEGLKGRRWLMKWLPARAYDSAVFVVFCNPVGMDGDQLKNGCSMVVDPFGDVLVECRSMGDEIQSVVCDPGKLTRAGGFRYREARRPELYAGIIGREHKSKLSVNWLK